MKQNTYFILMDLNKNRNIFYKFFFNFIGICMFVWKVRACDYVAQNHIIPNKYGANDFLSPCFEVGGIQFGE